MKLITSNTFNQYKICHFSEKFQFKNQHCPFSSLLCGQTFYVYGVINDTSNSHFGAPKKNQR